MVWGEGGRGQVRCDTRAVQGGEPTVLARIEVPLESLTVVPDVDPGWSRLAWADGRNVHVAPLEGTRLNTAAATTLEHDAVVTGVSFDGHGRQLATSCDLGRTIQIWSLERDPPELIRTLRAPSPPHGPFEAGSNLCFDSSGSKLAGYGGILWDLTAAPEAQPLRVQGCNWELAFHPEGRWLATGCGPVSLWPLGHAYPHVLTGHAKQVYRLAFTADGRRLVSTSFDNSVRSWPLAPDTGEHPRILHQSKGALGEFRAVATAPDGSFVTLGDNLGRVLVLPLDGGPARELKGFEDMILTVAVGPGSRLVAAGAGFLLPKDAVVRVWDLETNDVCVLNEG
jgi:cytochrome c